MRGRATLRRGRRLAPSRRRLDRHRRRGPLPPRAPSGLTGPQAPLPAPPRAPPPRPLQLGCPHWHHPRCRRARPRRRRCTPLTNPPGGRNPSASSWTIWRWIGCSPSTWSGTGRCRPGLCAPWPSILMWLRPCPPTPLRRCQPQMQRNQARATATVRRVAYRSRVLAIAMRVPRRTRRRGHRRPSMQATCLRVMRSSSAAWTAWKHWPPLPAAWHRP